MVDKNVLSNSSNSSPRLTYIIIGIIILLIIFIAPSLFKGLTGKATSQTVGANITTTNIAPQIYRVYSNATFLGATTSPTIDDVTNIAINFSVNDSDGVENLNDTTAFANVSFQGTVGRFNSSGCKKINSAGFWANYSCNIQLWYFDTAGEWNVTVRIGDISGVNATNATGTNITFSSLLAIVTHPGNLTFNQLAPGAVNQTPTNAPIIANNSGNQNASTVQVNATSLIGESSTSYAIHGGNFTTGVVTGSLAECDTTQTTLLSRSVFTTITNGVLPNGNHSINNGTAGQEQLYPCLRLVGRELPTQAYSTGSSNGPWVVKVT